MTPEVKTYVDKSDWERGPWDDEPDEELWVDEATGLSCLVVRGPLRAPCGYVGVPQEVRPWVGDSETLRVHGGVDYCHEAGGLYWLGFSCTHAGDRYPYRQEDADRGFYSDGTYRTWAYVKAECVSLAQQVKDRLEQA